MRNLLAEYPAWFEPDEVQILVAAFDKAWEAVQASSIRYPADKLESVRAILAKRIIAAAVDGERDLGRLLYAPTGGSLVRSDGCFLDATTSVRSYPTSCTLPAVQLARRRA
jgi:hypothetical protein